MRIDRVDPALKNYLKTRLTSFHGVCTMTFNVRKQYEFWSKYSNKFAIHVTRDGVSKPGLCPQQGKWDLLT